MLLLLCNVNAHAEDKKGKVVRVGWYESTFNHTDRQGRRSGYAYEYQQRIAANTGWTYEYVKGSWVELFGMLKRGEIDLLSDVSDNLNRRDVMLFSEQEMGTEDYYILAFAEDSTISAGDFSTLQGKRIGVNKDSMQAHLLRKWMKEHNVQMELLEYSGIDSDYIEMMERGEIDAVADISAFNEYAKDVCIPIARLGSSIVYFGINKSRPDLKRDLDKAMSQIHSHNPYYNRDLHEKYFGHTNIAKHLPANELEWLKQHGPIRIGYRDNYLPFSAKDPDTGEVDGLLRDFIEKVMSEMKGVQIVAVAYPTINDAFDAVRRGEVDVAFPNGMGVYETERAKMLSTDVFVNSAEMAVIRGNDYFHTDGKVRAAINSNNPNYISLISDKYPDWELVHFPSTYDCLKGVAEGKADLLLTSNYRLSVLNNDIEHFDLKTVGTGAVIPLNFAMDSGSSQLFSIMSRLKKLMTISEIHASLAKHSEVKRATTLLDFVKNNILLAFFFMASIIGIFLFLFLRSRRDHHRAVAANLSKTRFLFNMSHDIRTPMNAILGFSDLMSKNLDDKEKCTEYLEKVRSAGNFLLRLINNVLEMSRIESGMTEVNDEPTLISDLINELKDIYEDLMAKKGLKLIYSTNNLDVQAVYCDRTKINEIYMNLLSNAYKYTPTGGTVSVNTFRRPCDRPGYVTIEARIADSGIGMSADYLPHLFEDFTRERTYTDNKISGTGLGMSIVKKLVELMGGTIKVESELGKGTIFIVTLTHRIADEKKLLEHKNLEPKGTSVSFEGKHVLMAEDNDLNAEIAIEILSTLGFEIDRAEDGMICVDKLVKSPTGTYDLILMDIQMPSLNGYDATRQIRALDNESKASIPIIAMTANAFDTDKQDALHAGMDGHIAKPINMTELLNVLSAALSKTAKS